MIISYSFTVRQGHMYVMMRSFVSEFAIVSPVSVVFHQSFLNLLPNDHVYCSDKITMHYHNLWKMKEEES